MYQSKRRRRAGAICSRLDKAWSTPHILCLSILKHSISVLPARCAPPSASQPLPNEPLAGFLFCSTGEAANHCSRPSICVITKWRRDRRPTRNKTAQIVPKTPMYKVISCRDTRDLPSVVAQAVIALSPFTQGSRERMSSWLGGALRARVGDHIAGHMSTVLYRTCTGT